MNFSGLEVILAFGFIEFGFCVQTRICCACLIFGFVLTCIECCLFYAHVYCKPFILLFGTEFI